MIQKIQLYILLNVFSLQIFGQAPSVQWEHSYGGVGSDIATSICKTTDGGYMVAGTTDSQNNGDVTGLHGIYDFWLCKLDSLGDLVWQKTYGGSGEDYASEIQPTSDGGYVMVGTTKSFDGDVTPTHFGGDYWIVKISASGNIQWQKTFGGSLYDAGRSVKQTTDGGYIVAGYSSSDDGDITG